MSDPSLQCSLANNKVLISLTSATFSGQVVLKTSDGNSLTMTSSPNSHQNFRFGEEQLPITLNIYTKNATPISYLIDATCQVKAH
ncbi:hypothetical protein QWZ04_11895 [Vibrio tapetis subsp. quintayensis]|nr:hypothetical protein [Vibrio tapetis subsp. quintayensis]